MTICDGCGQDFDLDHPASVVHEPGCPWPARPAAERTILCACKERGADAGKGTDGELAWCCEECRLLAIGEAMITPVGTVPYAEVWAWFDETEEAPPDE